MNDTDKKLCPFCNQLERFKLVEAEYVKMRNDQRGKATAVYKAALIHELYYDGFCCGSTAYQTEELHYCPVCGERIDRSDEDGS